MPHYDVKDELRIELCNNVFVDLIEMVFQKTIWRLLLRVSLKKEGRVLGLQKNFRIRNGITEASIGF